MSGTERLRRAFAMRETVLALGRARLRETHPGMTGREIELRLAATWLPRETMRRAFGWDPGERS
jgi:hypothetical protein